jgi:hypothetical protein
MSRVLSLLSTELSTRLVFRHQLGTGGGLSMYTSWIREVSMLLNCSLMFTHQACHCLCLFLACPFFTSVSAGLIYAGKPNLSLIPLTHPFSIKSLLSCLPFSPMQGKPHPSLSCHPQRLLLALNYLYSMHSHAGMILPPTGGLKSQDIFYFHLFSA